MIRGKGSIRKDKEPDVRGKPGWQHVFNEPLHVVIEPPHTLPEPAASAALSRATEAVELLLVPVPEERDALKRHQLRALAIMNGTFRAARPYTPDSHLLPPPCSSSFAARLAHTAVPTTQVKVVASSALSAGGFIGREFYNGAFSNEALLASSARSAWEQVPSSSPPVSVSVTPSTSLFDESPRY
ncbi:unnamed protein product [Agarophyton chilense]